MANNPVVIFITLVLFLILGGLCLFTIFVAGHLIWQVDKIAAGVFVVLCCLFVAKILTDERRKR